MNFLNVPTHAPKAASYCQTIWALKSQRKLLAGRRTESIHLSIISPGVDVTGPLRVTVSVKAGNTRYSFSHWQGAMMLLNANKVPPHVWVLTERWERYVSRSHLRWGKNVVQHGKMAECSVKVCLRPPQPWATVAKGESGHLRITGSVVGSCLGESSGKIPKPQLALMLSHQWVKLLAEPQTACSAVQHLPPVYECVCMGVYVGGSAKALWVVMTREVWRTSSFTITACSLPRHASLNLYKQ